MNTIKIFRNSHFALAFISVGFLTLLSISGIILSIEPIYEKVCYFNAPIAKQQTIHHLLNLLQEHFKEIYEININTKGWVKVNGILLNGETSHHFVNPNSGTKILFNEHSKPIYKWVTKFHRSLFLKSTGRVLVGINSFLLLLITISGIGLLLQRQGNIKAIFTKIIKHDLYTYYHVYWSRLMLIPIVLISFTGSYLSIDTFELLPKNNSKHKVNYNQIKTDNILQNIALFDEIKLKDLVKLEFPFSTDIEDYFVVTTLSDSFYVHQYNGEILSKISFSNYKKLKRWCFTTHTGYGNGFWALILFLSGFSILFFIFSGFQISIYRWRHKPGTIKNTFKTHEIEHLILVGSQTQHTKSFANLFFSSLLKEQQKVYLTTLNEYHGNYPALKKLTIFTATYGSGTPPNNAHLFIQKFKKKPIAHSISYAIIGFGSTEYPKFCQFAKDIDLMFQEYQQLKTLIPFTEINKQSFTSFKQWIQHWNHKTGMNIVVKAPISSLKKHQVHDRSYLDPQETFTLQLKPKHNLRIQSGDWIGMKPKKEDEQRLYSIAIIDKKIVLSIKKHDLGLCSNFLYSQIKGNTIEGNIIQNPDFHFPNTSPQVAMISNGTGIAPFLGMIHNNQNKTPIKLFVGFKNSESTILYQKYLEAFIEKKKVTKIHYAYSKTEGMYVQNLVLQQKEYYKNLLDNKGHIMICGSLAMSEAVLKNLNIITTQYLDHPIEYYKELGQILIDCY